MKSPSLALDETASQNKNENTKCALLCSKTKQSIEDFGKQGAKKHVWNVI